MVLQPGIVKASGIDALVSGYSPEKVEEEKKILLKENKIQSLLEKFDAFNSAPGNWIIANICGKYLKPVRECLSPAEIDLFLRIVEEKYDKIGGLTGRFINHLIRISYSEGHRKFTLHPKARLNDLVNHFYSYKDRLELDVFGNLGYMCASSAARIHLTVHGDPGSHFANWADYCTFTIHGNTGGCALHAASCRFRSPNKKTIEQLQGTVNQGTKKHPSYNSIIFIHPDGREEVVRKYDGR